MIIEQSFQFDSFNSLFFFLFSFSDVTVRCQHNGYTYNVGETTPSQDGCNECTCRQNGNMECTNNICSNGELLLLISSLPKGAQYSGINKHVYPKTLNFLKIILK